MAFLNGQESNIFNAKSPQYSGSHKKTAANYPERPLSYKYFMINPQMYYMSLVLRKPVFGVSDLVPHKPGCAITQDG